MRVVRVVRAVRVFWVEEVGAKVRRLAQEGLDEFLYIYIYIYIYIALYLKSGSFN